MVPKYTIPLNPLPVTWRWLGAIVLLVAVCGPALWWFVQLEPLHPAKGVAIFPVIGLLAAFVLLVFLIWAWIAALRGGTELVFEEGVTVHYPWGKSARLAKEEFGEIVQFNRQYREQQLEMAVPVPMVGWYKEYSTKVKTKRCVVVLDKSKRAFFRFEMEPYDALSFSRWLHCCDVAQHVTRLRGTVTWTMDWISAVSLAGARVTDAEFQDLAVKLADIPQLHELDLSGNQVTDASWPAIQRLPSLKQIFADRTGLSPSAIADFNQAKQSQSRAGRFDFLNAN